MKTGRFNVLLISYAAPHLLRVDFLVRVQGSRFFEQDLGSFGDFRVGNATVIDRDRRPRIAVRQNARRIPCSVDG